jgi:phosphate transport system substrate-binding protein
MRKAFFNFTVLMLLTIGCAQSAISPTSAPTDAPTAAPTATPIPPTTTPAPAPDAALIAGDYPKVDGSTSAHPLQVIVACKVFDVPYVWQPQFLTNLRGVFPSPEYEGPPEPVVTIFNIQHSGTHDAYVNLIEGNADFILVARQPSEDELNAASQNGVALDVRPVALDAFVFLVNAENPVDDLTIEAIRDIYMGKITTWPELGVDLQLQQSEGDGDQINAYQRNPNSGSQELMEALVMKGDPMIDAPDMMLETMMGPINVIGEDLLGIGYSVYYYVTFIQPDPLIKLIGINGVQPTSEAIAERAYPLTAEVYAVVREDMPQDSTAVMLRDWLLTEEGQAAVEESGYVPIQ